MNPTDDMPSVETEACDLGGCREPWAWEDEERRNGPRALRLCEGHADEWLAGRTDMHPYTEGNIAAARSSAAKCAEAIAEALRAPEKDAWRLIGQAFGHATQAKAQLDAALEIEDTLREAGE